ncbi:hypothetical protein [Hydrogenimonas thermophila]|uniref:Uncharacterized protein n=1 Tax=Hydrogenimonas thermophila TaxID=223786 RepID=A0A1I5UUX5_9BACT|nr:hypothetical protein [Hydrogenimonas thermophila]SFP99055.1 hypothetical protein SAMN05216234_1722 [Hydrogenimonas thermophila]
MKKICISLPENLYRKLIKKAKIAQIPAEKIIEIYLIENFFKEKDTSHEKEKSEYFLTTFKDKFKELEITQEDLSRVFKVATSSISKALNGKQKNFVYKEFNENKKNIDLFIKEIYLKVLKNNQPDLNNDYYDECLKNGENYSDVFKLFLGFVNKKLNGYFNEDYFLNHSDIDELIKDLSEIDIDNLSPNEIHDKFEYIYLNHYEDS